MVEVDLSPAHPQFCFLSKTGIPAARPKGIVMVWFSYQALLSALQGHLTLANLLDVIFPPQVSIANSHLIDLSIPVLLQAVWSQCENIFRSSFITSFLTGMIWWSRSTSSLHSLCFLLGRNLYLFQRKAFAPTELKALFDDRFLLVPQTVLDKESIA